MKASRQIHIVGLVVALATMGWLISVDRNDSTSVAGEPRIAEKETRSGGQLAQWVRSLDTADEAADLEPVIEEGVFIARERLEALKDLARTRPAAALGEMMSMDELTALPDKVREASEIPVSSIADIDLRWQTSVDSDGTLQCSHRNVARIDGKTVEVVGTGLREAHPPVRNAILNGYLLGDLLLLDSTPVRIVEDKEQPFVDRFFHDSPLADTDPMTGNPAESSVSAIIAGKRYGFESASSLEYAQQLLEHFESLDSETGGSDELAWLMADSGDAIATSNIMPPPPQQGPLKVLFIRANFADLMATPISKPDLDNTLTTVKSKIEDFSHNNSTLDFTVTPILYTLPLNSVTVAQAGDNDTIINAARTAASFHHTLADFDVVAVYFPNLSGIPGSNITYGGLASVGGANHWINGVSEFGRVPVILHEFGHNYGLYHANYYDPGKTVGGLYLDPLEESLENGDIFDRMGSGNADTGYFSPFAMSRLTWLDQSKIEEVNGSGTWRIHRFDHPLASLNTRLALRVPVGGGQFHWVGLRQLSASQKAYIVNEGFYEDRPNLIDATPGSQVSPAADRADAPLPLGASFVDPSSGVTYTTLAAGGNEPNQWIDVKVDFDPRLELVSTQVVVDEAAGHAELRIKRSFSASEPCSVSYSTTGLTATSGVDFHAASGTVSWEAGDLSEKSVLIPIRPDDISEAPETLTLTISSPQGAAIVDAASSATVTIIDAGARITTFDPPFFNTSVNAVVPQPDGKVVIGGSINTNLTGNIARLNADGSDDPSFQKGAGFNGTVQALALQNDGKILVGGDFTTYDGLSVSRIARLNPDGTVDASFRTAIGTGANSTVHALAIEPNGKILAGGAFDTFNGSPSKALVRLLASGARDNATPVTTGFQAGIGPTVLAIVPEDDGKITIGGLFIYPFAPGVGFRSGIARLASNGSRDLSFEPGFGAHALGDTSFLEPVHSVAKLADGKYLVGGRFTGFNGTSANRLVRLNPGGSRDLGFVPPAFNDTVESVIQDPAGRLIVCGYFTNPAGKIIALTETGAIDGMFNLQGGTTSFSIRELSNDSSGDLFIAGNFFNFAGITSRPVLKVAGGSDRYESWKNSVFSALQIAGGDTGPEEDFDGDGILNVAEMALGTLPTVADPASRFAVAAGNLSLQSVADNRYLTATMERSAENLGVWLVAQFSDDLVTWTPEDPVPGPTTEYDVVESTSARFTVRDKSELGDSPKRFVRFKAALPN